MKNMYRIVAKFEYNNNKYFIALVNDRNVVIVKYDENKNISTSFSDEEYELLNIVYNSLLINKDKSVYIKDLKVKDILYKIYYDTQSKNYFWESANGIDDEECNKILNFKYNNMKCVYYLDEKDNENDEEKKDSRAKRNLTAFDELERIAEETIASLEKLEFQKEIQEIETKIDEDENEKAPVILEPEIVEELEKEKTEEAIVDETLKEAVIDEELEDILDEEETTEEIKEVQGTVGNEDELEELVEHIEENSEEFPEELTKEEQEVSDEVKGNFDQPLDEIIRQVAEIVQKQKIEQDLQRMKEIEEEKKREQKRKIKEKELEYHRKFVRFKKKIVPIFVSSTMLLAPLVSSPVVGSQGRKENNILKVVSENVDEIKKNESEYDYKMIKSIIASNPYLKNEEKEFLYKLKIVFDEDYKYMDLDLIEDRLKNLKIKYNDNYMAGDSDNFSFVGGTYDELENQISINGAKDFGTSNIVDFSHETFHVFQKSSQRYVMELFNEGYKREKLRELKDKGILDEKAFIDSTDTYSNFGNGYSDDLYVYYTLASLMDEKSIKEYQYSCDDRIIVKKLMEIDKESSSKDEAAKNAYQLLDSIDELRIWDENTQTYRTNLEAGNDVFDRLNYYYIQKNGINLDEDLRFVIHKMYCNDITYSALEKTLLAEIDQPEDGSEKIFGPWRTILPRTYLTDDYEYPSITFNSPEMITIEIDDELCEEYQKNYNTIKENNRRANQDKDDMER